MKYNFDLNIIFEMIDKRITELLSNEKSLQSPAKVFANFSKEMMGGNHNDFSEKTEKLFINLIAYLCLSVATHSKNVLKKEGKNNGTKEKEKH